MARSQRQTPGIRRTDYGWQVYVQVGGQFISEHHPKTATLAELKARRDEMKVEARRRRTEAGANTRAHRGTLAADVKDYLRQVAAMPSYSFREREINAWLERFGDRPRATITAAEVREQLQAWRTEGPIRRYQRTKDGGRVITIKRGLSASACNHRRTALLHLYTVLDGKDAPNPVRAVPAFVEPPPEPRGRPISLLKRIIDRVPVAKSKARLQVLMWTGIRGNSELGKMTADHVDLKGAVCYVPTGKGGARFRVIPLNKEGVAAWRAFMKAKAWGPYDKEALRSALRRAAKAERADAEKAGREVPNLERLKVYDLRHSVATELLKKGADLADVQEFLGHTTPRMTRRYAPFQREKLAAAIAKLRSTA